MSASAESAKKLLEETFAAKPPVEALAAELEAWRERMVMRVREALEIGYALGTVNMCIAVETAVMGACVANNIDGHKTDKLVRAVRRTPSPPFPDNLPVK